MTERLPAAHACGSGLGNRMRLGPHCPDPAADGVDATCDRLLDRRAVGHAARETGAPIR